MTKDTAVKAPLDLEVLKKKAALSPDEVAFYIGCGRTQCYKILREKIIPSYRVERSIRVRREHVDAYIRERLEENSR